MVRRQQTSHAIQRWLGCTLRYNEVLECTQELGNRIDMHAVTTVTIKKEESTVGRVPRFICNTFLGSCAQAKSLAELQQLYL